MNSEAEPGKGDEYRRELPRRSFFNDMPDKGLFAFISIVGFANIVALKLQGVSSDIVAGVAVILMLAYGTIAYRIRAVHIRLDRLGDNFYYLGFIFTLASMSAALIQLRNGINIETILDSFGIALVTTIVGIAGRVIFVQMRTELDDAEAIIRQDILSASSELKAQLGAAIQDFETFRTAVRQSLSEDITRSTDVAKAQLERIGDVAQTAASRIDAAFLARQNHAQNVSDLVTEMSKAVATLAQEIKAVDVPNQLQRQLNSLGDELGSLVTRIEVAVNMLEKARQQRKTWRRFWG